LEEEGASFTIKCQDSDFEAQSLEAVGASLDTVTRNCNSAGTTTLSFVSMAAAVLSYMSSK
jgi:hypothetical protein